MNQVQKRRLKFSVFLKFWEWIKPAWRTEALDYSGLEILEQISNIWYVIISFKPEIFLIGLIFKIPFLSDRKLTVFYHKQRAVKTLYENTCLLRQSHVAHELTVWKKFDFPRNNGGGCGAYCNHRALTG